MTSALVSRHGRQLDARDLSAQRQQASDHLRNGGVFLTMCGVERQRPLKVIGGCGVIRPARGDDHLNFLGSVVPSKKFSSFQAVRVRPRLGFFRGQATS